MESAEVRALLRLFDRPRAAPRPPPKMTIAAASPSEHAPTSGLLTVEICAAADVPTEVVLRVFAGKDGGPALEKRLGLSPAPLNTWVSVHGHLLPNGAADVRLELNDLHGVLLAETFLTLQVRNAGELAEITRASLQRSGAPLSVDVCDSSVYDYADRSLAAWYDRTPAEADAHIAMLADTGQATDAEVAALRHFVEEGYLVLPDVIGPEHLKRLNAALDDAVGRKIEGYEWGSSQRLHDLHKLYPAIHELWLHPAILRMLRLIFGAPARPCQSLTYVFGSQQKHHQDTIALTSFPQGRMCGVWTALEDVRPDSGELVVFPKSHRLPRVYMADADLPKVTDDWTAFGRKVTAMWNGHLQPDTAKFRRELYRPKAGAVLIWHENLMHAGSTRLDESLSRRSIVGHYFAEGSIVYFDASGMPGVLYEGELPA